MLYKMRKSQSALEFVVLSSFMLLAVIVVFALVSTNVLEAKEEGNKKIAQDIAEFVYHEIETAKSVNDGYVRLFTVPEFVNGVNYTINLTENRELMVKYLGHEYIRFVQANVSGNISKGLVQIEKTRNIIRINSIVECNDNKDNDRDNKIDLSDAGCQDVMDKDETNCGDNACEGGENCVACAPDCGPCSSLSNLLFKSGQFNAILFDYMGNAVLKGTLRKESSISQVPGEDEIIINDRNGVTVAILSLATGSMIIKGNVMKNQGVISPGQASNDFIVRDYAGNVVSYIDEYGNLILKGTLTQNGNP